MDIVAVWLTDFLFAGLWYVLYVCQSYALFHCAESSPFCNSYHRFTLLFLSEQTRHGRKIVFFYSFLFICGRAKHRTSNVWGHECNSSWLLLQLQSPAYLERWRAALKEAGRSVSVVMKRPTITRVEPRFRGSMSCVPRSRNCIRCVPRCLLHVYQLRPELTPNITSCVPRLVRNCISCIERYGYTKCPTIGRFLHSFIILYT